MEPVNAAGVKVIGDFQKNYEHMAGVEVLFLSRQDIDALALSLHCYGEIGEVVAGLKPGRESQQERIVFWHKGFAVSDIVIGNLAYEKAREQGIGTLLSYDSAPRDM